MFPASSYFAFSKYSKLNLIFGAEISVNLVFSSSPDAEFNVELKTPFPLSDLFPTDSL